MLQYQVNRVKKVLPVPALPTGATSPPQTPFDSNAAFHNVMFNWQLMGMIAPARHRVLYYCYSLFVNIFSSVFTPVSLLMNLFFINKIEELMSNLSLSTTFVMTTVKQIVIFFKLADLKRVALYLRPLDARCSSNSIDRQHVNDGIRVCRIFYMAFMLFYATTGYGLAYVGFTKHLLPYNGWFPRLLRDPEHNYLLAFVYQCLAQFFTIVQNTANDLYPQCYVVVMIGHLRALATRIERIGKNPRLKLSENQQELLDCIQDHKNILAYFECIRPVISITIFLQFLVTAFVLCVTAVNIIWFQRELSQLVFSFMYVIIILVEVFPCCWYANVLMQESSQLTTAMYSCNWYEQDQKFRKTLIIFMQRSQKTNIIMAGNMAPVTLQTFVATLKFSFSAFTILRNMQI